MVYKKVISFSACSTTGVPDVPCSIILDNNVGGHTDVSVWPQTFSIDYCRVWQTSGKTCPVGIETFKNFSQMYRHTSNLQIVMNDRNDSALKLTASGANTNENIVYHIP